MPKFKWVVLYIVAAVAAIILFSSFEAQFYFTYAATINLSDKMMMRAYTNDFSNIASDGSEITVYSEGDSDDMITTFKVKLYLLDYMSYPTDNTFDAATKTAVENYQTAKGLTVNGMLDAPTQEALNAEEIEYVQGHMTSAIIPYQETLIELGYLAEGSQADGNFTQELQTAIESYQTNNSLTVTGTINKQTQEALSRPISEQTPATPAEQ